MKDLFQSQLEILEKLFINYNESLIKMKNLDFESLETASDFEPVDAFFSRFWRMIDFIFQQNFRTIFKIETLSDWNPTLREVIFLMWKIWIVKNIDEIIELKELRNEITHEYLNSNIEKDVKRIIKLENTIFNLFKNVKSYWK